MDGDKSCAPHYSIDLSGWQGEDFADQEPWEEPHVVNRTYLWTYVSPDGAKHTFLDEFDHDSQDAAPHVFYSRDNTFLRLTLNNSDPDNATAATLEMPDGSRHRFSLFDAENRKWRLDRMENAYGTGVDILYSADQWELADDAGRHHFIQFDQSGYDELGPQVSQVNLETFGGERALYDFQYQSAQLPWCYRNKLSPFFETRPPFTFPLLTAIDMPSGVTYSVLSTEVFSGSDGSGYCTGALERSTAVRYGTDQGIGIIFGEYHNPWTDTNRRIEASRLARVEEPGSGGLDADYGYDVGNRLSSVTLSGSTGVQERSFDYDHRGFLLSEIHPPRSPCGTVTPTATTTPTTSTPSAATPTPTTRPAA